MKCFLSRAGMRYRIWGLRITGSGVGKKKLVPTINIRVDNDKFLPGGVFLVRMKEKGGKYRWGAANIGVAPTIKQLEKKIIEVHILDAGLPQGREMEIELVSFLRKEKKFGAIAGLRKAVQLDLLEAKKLIPAGKDLS